MEAEQNKNDTLLNFKYNTDNNKEFLAFKNFPVQKVYLITNDDYKNGQSYLEKNDSSTLDHDFNFCNSFKDIKQDFEYNIVTEDFLTKIKYDNIKYEGKHVLYFSSSDKQYLLFIKDLNILEITKNQKSNIQNNFANNAISNIKVNDGGSSFEFSSIMNNNNNSNSNSNTNSQKSIEEKKALFKNLKKIYENEKYFMKLFESPIKYENENDIKEYYIINYNFINAYKGFTNYKEVQNIFESNDNKNENLDNNIETQILSKIKLIPEENKKNLFKEDNFFPLFNNIKCFDSELSINYFYDFILVKEKITNLSF